MDYVPQGSHIPSGFIIGAGQKISSYLWPKGGFARLDGSRNGSRSLSEQWSPLNWTAGAIKIEGFREKTVTFHSKRVGCLLNQEAKVVRILTREAATPRETAVHHRAPSRIPDNMSFESWLSRLNSLTGANYCPMQ